MGERTVKYCDGCKREFTMVDDISTMGIRIRSRKFQFSTIVLASEYYTESGPYGERTRQMIDLEFCEPCAKSIKKTLERLLEEKLKLKQATSDVGASTGT